jgi:hypothetical protein
MLPLLRILDPADCEPRYASARWRFGVAAAVLCAASPAALGQERVPEKADPPPLIRAAAAADGDGRLTSDASFYEAVLTNPTADSAVRRAAAERLVRDRSPEATQAIERVLRGKSSETLAAVIEALDRAEARVPTLADALVAAIASELTLDRGAAARVLALSDARATELLWSVADRGELPQRTGAIVGLGELRTRDAAARLIALLDGERHETAAIVQAACAALDRCTGAKIGADPARWRGWWEDSSQVQSEAGADAALKSRVETAERAVAEARRRGDRLAERLLEVYGQLFLHLTQNERMQRSAELLSDSLPEVRTFAVAQIERLLRNGERADDSTRRAMTVLLDDPVPTLRAHGVRLLDDLAAPELAVRVAERLPRERDPEVSAAYLAALANRPAAEAFAPTLPLVTDPVLGEAACIVMNRLHDAKLLPPDAPARLLGVLRETLATRPSGAAAQLLATIGDEADLQRVTVALDSNDPAVRRGAAEGLRRRGVRRPLLERSKDPAIYGPLVAALADEPRTLATLDQIIAASPPADLVSEWNAAVARLLRDLPLADLPAADIVLERATACEARTRIAGLTRFASSALGGLRRADVEAGLRRYVDLLIANERSREVFELLESLQPKEGEPTRDALFRAYALSGEFRKATQLDATAPTWLGLLESVIADPARARPIADEISLRFVGGGGGVRFTAAERERFERLCRGLPPTSTDGEKG